jgi:hypothetical protein
MVAMWMGSGNKGENFTIAERDGILCNPTIRNTEEPLLPNSAVFLIQGYNYKETPSIYRNGEKIVPLQFFWDYSSMVYYFTVHAPNGICGSEWRLVTSDYVKPVVNNGRTGEEITVTSERRRGGFNWWKLSC